MATTLIKHPWEPALRDLVRSARERLIISAPFITWPGWNVVDADLAPGAAVHVATALDARMASTGFLDVDALLAAARRRAMMVRDVRALHAKVYVADGSAAIVTSGNLTEASLRRNVERGLLVTDRRLVAEIAEDVIRYAGSRPAAEEQDLLPLAELAEQARQEHGETLPGVQALTPAEREFEERVRQLHGARGRSQNAIFGETIMALLRDGPLATAELHPKIQAIHPDICNDDEDRVINGIRFGKKWKHAVRNAQQYLKRQGRIEQSPDGHWRCSPPESLDEQL